MARQGVARLGKDLGGAWRGSAWLGKEANGLKTFNSEEDMKQYQITLQGLTPLLMHKDNLMFSEKINEWRHEPENKAHIVPGDDRTPPWTWIGYIYHDGDNIGVDSDNIMTMLREGGSKVLTGKRQETYKKHTQSGIMLDQQQFDLYVNNCLIGMEEIRNLVGDLKFKNHIDLAEDLGFELLVKRAKIGKAKHVRVRPMFRSWELRGSLTVLDEELTGLTHGVLETVLNQAGALCGLCDWRPSSPSSGTFGKFKPIVELM